MTNHRPSPYRVFFPGLLLLSLILGACNTIGENASTTTEMNHPAAGRFVWHDLITHDLQQAQQFYGALFDWKFDKAENRSGNPYALASIEGRYSVGLLEIERPENGDNYSRWLGYMAVNQLDQAVQATRAAGGQQVGDTEKHNEVGRATAILDPEQAVLGLIQSQVNFSDFILRSAPGAVVWNELLSDDPEAAAVFYEALTGIDSDIVERRGGRYTLLKADDQQMAGILRNPFKTAEPLWLTYIAVLDPEATVARVESLGGKVLLAPSQAVREGNMALIQDPGGAILAIQKWPVGERG